MCPSCSQSEAAGGELEVAALWDKAATRREGEQPRQGDIAACVGLGLARQEGNNNLPGWHSWQAGCCLDFLETGRLVLELIIRGEWDQSPNCLTYPNDDHS